MNEPIPFRGTTMSFPDRRTAGVLLTILLFAGVLAIAYIAREVLVIFCFSILFAYLMNPVVRFLQRHSLFLRGVRGPHVAEAYFVLLLVSAVVIYVLAPGLPSRTGKLLQGIPTLSERLRTGEIATEVGHEYGWSGAQTLHVKTFLVQHQSAIQKAMTTTQRFVTTALGSLALVPILAIFFLSNGQKLADQAIRLFAANGDYKRLESLASELNTTLHHYVQAQVTLSGLSLVYTSTALLISGFPRALALGLLAGVLEFVPIAGWMTAAATITAVGIVTHAHWVWMAAFLGIWRVVIDYVIAPRVFGRHLAIEPLLAIFTLMIGGVVGGLTGAYLALPIAAIVRVIWRRVDGSRADEGNIASPLPAEGAQNTELRRTLELNAKFDGIPK